MTDSHAESDVADEPKGVVRSSDAISYDPVDAAPGLSKGVLIGADEGAPNFAIRRFVLEPGTTVPRHTNAVEHVQYVLEGTYTVGLEDDEYEVDAGDSLLIPAGAVHWYRNESNEAGAFLCAVPHGDDDIELLE